MKSAFAVFLEITWNLWIAFSSIDILMTFILSIHAHEISFHLFVSSSVFSSMSYHFPSAGLLPLWLNLYLVTLLFLMQF